MINTYSYMIPRKEQIYETESYVAVPPALIITDEANTVWTLGFNDSVSGGEFAYDVLRNGQPVGERANRIERRNGRVRIYGPEGWKVWTGKSFF